MSGDSVITNSVSARWRMLIVQDILEPFHEAVSVWSRIALSTLIVETQKDLLLTHITVRMCPELS